MRPARTREHTQKRNLDAEKQDEANLRFVTFSIARLFRSHTDATTHTVMAAANDVNGLTLGFPEDGPHSMEVAEKSKVRETFSCCLLISLS